MDIYQWKCQTVHLINRNPDMGRAEKVVLAEMLLGAVIKDGKFIYGQSRARMCYLTDFSMKPLVKALTALEEEGYITTIPQPYARRPEWQVHPEAITTEPPF